MDQVKLMEAYARLTAMREHLPGRIPPSLADEFHSILEMLEGNSGVDLRSFRIPPEAIHPAVTTQQYSEWGGRPFATTSKPYCETSTFLMKLDGVLRLFQLLNTANTTRKAAIGFRGPEEPVE